MKRQGKADVVRVMGIKWTWNYTERCWQGHTPIGAWRLWYDGKQWLLKSPGDVIYTLLRQHRYEAMVTAGYKIAEIERWLGR